MYLYYVPLSIILDSSTEKKMSFKVSDNEAALFNANDNKTLLNILLVNSSCKKNHLVRERISFAP